MLVAACAAGSARTPQSVGEPRVEVVGNVNLPTVGTSAPSTGGEPQVLAAADAQPGAIGGQSQDALAAALNLALSQTVPQSTGSPQPRGTEGTVTPSTESRGLIAVAAGSAAGTVHASAEPSSTASISMPLTAGAASTSTIAAATATEEVQGDARALSIVPALPVSALPGLALAEPDPSEPALPEPALAEPAQTAAVPEPAPVASAAATPPDAPQAEALQPTALQPDGAQRQIRVPVLMYHYLSVPPANADIYRKDLSVAPELFAQHLDRIRAEGYTTITPYDFIAALQTGTPLPEKPVLITFDDGYRDNYENAFPLLRERGMVATFFVVTDFFDEERP